MKLSTFSTENITHLSPRGTCQLSINSRHEVVIGLTTFAYRYEGLRREDFDEVLGVATRRGETVAVERPFEHTIFIHFPDQIMMYRDIQRYIKLVSSEVDNVDLNM